jgi:hypothetical protein
MSFVVPPLPGETLHPVKTIADDNRCTVQAVYDAIKEGRIEAIRIAGRWLITDSERRRLLRHGWPSKNPGVSQFWEDWRAYRRQRATAQPMEVA